MKLKTKLIVTGLILIAGLHTEELFSQSVDYKNKVEFSQEGATGDLNSITLGDNFETETPSHQESEEIIDNEANFADLEAILDMKRLRFRNVRKTTDKCYRDSEEVCKVSHK